MMKKLLPLLLVILTTTCVLAEEIIDIAEETGLSLQSPCAAFDDLNNVFLIVWSQQTSETATSIFAQWLDEDGNQLSAPFHIAYGTNGTRTQPAVAYNRTNGIFIVIYVLDDTSIWGQRYTYSGPIASSYKITDGTKISVPVISYEPGSNQFLLAYADEDEHIPGTVNSEIYLKYLSQIGSTLASPGKITNSAPSNSAFPAIASICDRSMLVCQTGPSGGPYHLYVKIIDDNTTDLILGNVLAYENDSSRKPAIAANERLKEFLVLYSAKPDPDSLWQIHGIKLNYDDSPYHVSYVIADDASHDLTNPSVAYDRDSKTFLAAWSGTSSGGSSLVQRRRIDRFAGPITGEPITTIESYTGMFGRVSSPQVVTNDADVALIPYAKNWLQTTPITASQYQIRAWHDEGCIDADINCDGDVNLHDLVQLAESWLIGQ